MATLRQQTEPHRHRPRTARRQPPERCSLAMKRWPLRGLTVAAAIGVALVAGEAFGCPTCKDSLADGDAVATNLARGYFYSILLMLAMPFTLAGSFGLYVWREMRRQRAPSDDGSSPGNGQP